MPVFFLKIQINVEAASDQSETEQNNLYFTRNDMGPVHNKAGLQLDKKEKK